MLSRNARSSVTLVELPYAPWRFRPVRVDGPSTQTSVRGMSLTTMAMQAFVLEASVTVAEDIPVDPGVPAGDHVQVGGDVW